MGKIFIADFGTKDNIKTFRINGNREDLIKLVTECTEIDAKFIEPPEMERIRRSEWTMVLKIDLGRGISDLDNSS